MRRPRSGGCRGRVGHRDRSHRTRPGRVAAPRTLATARDECLDSNPMGAFGMSRSQPRTPSRVLRRQAVSVAAMSFIVLLTIGVSIPASAFGTYSSDATARTSVAAGRTQGASVSRAASGTAVGQDGFAVTLPVVPKVVIASGAGGGGAEPSVSGVSFIAA